MNKRQHYRLLILILSLHLLFAEAKAQGCSDAGFCSMGNMKPLAADTTVFGKQSISLLFTNGLGDEGVYVFTPAVQYDRRLGKQWKIQTRLTWNYASGNLGRASGPGDLFISGSYLLPEKQRWEIALLLAGKMGLSTGNLQYENKALPMQYQSSLGTIDLIAGISVTRARWLFSVGVQQPISGSNHNSFLPQNHPSVHAAAYPPSARLNRKGDVLLRASANVLMKRKWKINAGLLCIYHLGKDTYIDETVSNVPIGISGSSGLTINGTTALRYTPNRKLSFVLSAGMPFMVRDVRPDGLTRSIVLTPEINFRL